MLRYWRKSRFYCIIANVGIPEIDMKFFLLLAIKLYWVLVPESNRRICIYHTSCSQHVFNTAKSDGFFKGITCFLNRIKNCNGKYHLSCTGNEYIILTSGGEILREQEINLHLLKRKKDGTAKQIKYSS
jgi:putative component of membrane protein insertase Oxa1/YidC/SpoIIIJ protein YidD